MKKDSVIIYAAQYQALRSLSNEEMGRLFHEIFRWLKDEQTGQDELSPALLLAFQFMTLQISIDNKKYLQKKGRVLEWKKRYAEKSATEINNSSHARVNVNDNEHENGNEDGNDNENVDENEDVSFSLSINSQSENIDACEDEEQKKEEKDERAIKNFVEYWNNAIEQTGSAMRKVKLMTEARREKLLKIVHTIPAEDSARAIHRAMNSPFCNGATKRRSRPVDFDWLIEYQNFIRLLENSL
jgi:hypothetical protein